MKVYISSDRTYALHPLRSILKIISFFVYKIFEWGGGGGGGGGRLSGEPCLVRVVVFVIVSLSCSERFFFVNSNLPLLSSAKNNTSIPRTYVRMSK